MPPESPNPRLLRHILATQPISLAVCVTCGKRCLAKCHHYVNYKCNRLRLGPKEGVWPVGGTKSQCMRLCGSYTSVSGAKAEVLKRCVFANSALSLIARHYLLFCRCVQLSGSDMSSLAASELLMYVNGVYWCTARYKFYGLSSICVWASHWSSATWRDTFSWSQLSPRINNLDDSHRSLCSNSLPLPVALDFLVVVMQIVFDCCQRENIQFVFGLASIFISTYYNMAFLI